MCQNGREPHSSEFTSVRDDEPQKPSCCSQEGGKCEEVDIGPGCRGKGCRSLSGSLGPKARAGRIYVFAFPLTERALAVQTTTPFTRRHLTSVMW